MSAMKWSPFFIVPCGTFLFNCYSSVLHADIAPLVTMVTEDDVAKNAMQNGLRDLLMGWDERARLHFREAVSADADCALAWCGLLLTEGNRTDIREQLSRFMEQEVRLTPQEAALLSGFLRWAQGDASGAGEEFAERAARYRNDLLSACWAIRLLHNGYEEIGGKPLPRQQRALELAQQLYERFPQDFLVAFMRGWVEESAQRPSAEALSAARFAAQSMPQNPAAQHLYGHLLYRNGQIQDALPYFHSAADFAERERKNVPHGTMEQGKTRSYPLELWPLELRAKLYESTLLWLNGHMRESLLIQSQLLKQAAAVDSRLAQCPGAVLLHWEARTLPLRMLMLNPELPTDKQVAGAVMAATPLITASHDPMLELRDCLRFCLVARQRAAANLSDQAQKCLQTAEKCARRFEAARDLCAGQGSYTLSAWVRGHEACTLALHAAKAEVYPSTADIWLHGLEKGQKTSSMLMPPVLPLQKK